MLKDEPVKFEFGRLEMVQFPGHLEHADYRHGLYHLAGLEFMRGASPSDSFYDFFLLPHELRHRALL